MWPEKHKVSSIQIPKNLTDFSRHILPTRVIILSPTYKLVTWVWVFGSWNKINLDFLAFIVSWFELNHCSAYSSSLFAFWMRVIVSEPEIWKVQSSANNKVNIEVAFAKSFIKNKKSNGPKQLPCGIPEEHGNLLEFTFDTPEMLDKWTYCCLFFK